MTIASVVSGKTYTGMGAAFVYMLSNGDWSMIGSPLIPTSPGITPKNNLNFGISVALFDNFIVVGCYPQFCGSSTCSTPEVVNVYSLSGTTITYLQTLKPPTSSAYIGFGLSVAINSNYIQVGARFASTLIDLKW
jgi:hypothetical protein